MLRILALTLSLSTLFTSPLFAADPPEGELSTPAIEAVVAEFDAAFRAKDVARVADTLAVDFRSRFIECERDVQFGLGDLHRLFKTVFPLVQSYERHRTIESIDFDPSGNFAIVRSTVQVDVTSTEGTKRDTYTDRTVVAKTSQGVRIVGIGARAHCDQQ